MNITSINPYYSSVSFRANNNSKKTHSNKASNPNNKTNEHANKKAKGKYQNKPSSKTTGLVTGTGLALLAIVSACGLSRCSYTPTTQQNEPTAPEIIVVDTTEPTQPEVTQTKREPVIKKVVTTKPINERTANWYTIVKGDRLADIVRKQLPELNGAPDDEMSLYYALLQADNPGKLDNPNTIIIGTQIRIDSISPENIQVEYVDLNAVNTPEETQSEIEDVLFLPETEAVVLNNVVFEFDEGSVKKVALRDSYSGTYAGKAVEVAEDLFGSDVTYTKHVSENLSSPVELTETYNKNGELTKKIVYKDGKATDTYDYTYTATKVVETHVYKKSDAGIPKDITVYNRKDDTICSRTFTNSSGKTIAIFDFENKTATIGEDFISLDDFNCNDILLGSQKYTGISNGIKVQFDVHRNGIIVERIGNNGNIQYREEYNSKGVLISEG